MKIIVFDNDKRFIRDIREGSEFINKNYNMGINFRLATNSKDKIINELKENRDITMEPCVYIINPVIALQNDGIELAKEIRRYNPIAYIVFASKGDYLSKIYFSDVKFFTYFFKPVGQGELYKLVRDVEEDFNVIKNNFTLHSGGAITFVSLYKKVVLYVDNIIAIEYKKPKTYIHTKNGVITCNLSMKELYQKIEAASINNTIVRIHSGYLVNTINSTEIDVKNNLITTISGAKYPIARARKKEVIKRFESKLAYQN